MFGWFFTIVGWLIFGVIIGAVARFVLPGKQEMSLLMTALLGIAGSFVGGAISWLIFGTPEDGEFHAGGWIMSFVGAFLLVLAYSRLQARKTKP